MNIKGTVPQNKEEHIIKNQHYESANDIILNHCNKDYQNDIFVELLKRELKTVAPTYEQLLEIIDP